MHPDSAGLLRDHGIQVTAQRLAVLRAVSVLEPTFDGFRNYLADGHEVPAEVLLVERAQMLTLTAPEMRVLVGACGRSVRTPGGRTSASSRRVRVR